MNFNDIHNYLNVLREFYTINRSAHKNRKNTSILKRNSELRDKYNGKRIILLFTGSSINNIDFKLLKNEYVFGCNYLVLHKDFDDLNIEFYSDLDTWSYRIHNTYSWLFRIIYAKNKPGTKIFSNASSYDFIKHFPGFRKEDNYYLGFNSSFNDVSNVSVDIENLTNIITGGVFSSNIGISIYMGFKTIYLVGADYTKDPLIVGHFYDGERVLERASPDLVRGHEIINEFAEKRGVAIYNVVDNGFSSRTFKQIRTDEFLKILE